MKAGKNHQEEEEDEDEEFGGKRDIDVIPSTNPSRDGKSSGKANVTRSKHSVTEQRRRRKINERYQILKRLIPDSDPKRDTASFLLEVINYVKFLQEKVQKYEGSYQTWSSGPTKLMPWRNSHWPVHSFVSESQNSALRHSVQQNSVEQEAHCGSLDQETELSKSSMGIPLHLHTNLPYPILNNSAFSNVLDGPPPDGPTGWPSYCDALNHQGELKNEGGTVSISSLYSQRLLNSLTQALQLTGLDLSQATVSVKVNLGKQVDRSSMTRISPKDHGIPLMPGGQAVGNFEEPGQGEDVDRSKKRQKA